MAALYLLGPFAICAIIGFIVVIRATRSLRAPRSYHNALLAWREPARADFRADLSTWAAINLHRFTAIGLGLLEVLVILGGSAAQPGPLTTGSLTTLLMAVLVPGAVSIMGIQWGFVSGGPLAEVIGGDHHYAVAEQGILALGYLHPWRTFREFSFDPPSGLIFLWSAPMPGAVAFTFKPSSHQEIHQLLGILQDHLPAQVRPPGMLRRYGFPLLMAVFCSVFIAAALLFCLHPTVVTVLTIPVLLWLFLATGSILMMRAIYGGRGQPATGGPA